MKAILKLSGFDYDKEIAVEWNDDPKSLPLFAFYDDRFWGAIFYDKDLQGRADFVMMYSEYKKAALPIDMNGNPFPVTDLAQMFNLNIDDGKQCECGAKFTDFPNFHMTMCPKWKKQ